MSVAATWAETAPRAAPAAERDRPLFVYLCFGRSPSCALELRYSLESLRAVGAEAAIYAETPAQFAGLDATVIDAVALIREALAHEYKFRVKPRVLADALRRFGRPCVLLDTDSFVRPGFPQSVERALAGGAAMNQFVRDDPYPFFPDFETDLPHLGRYRLDRAAAKMLNSGLVAVSPAHLSLIEDACALIDRFWAAGLRKHDIEQFAIAETLRLGGVRIALIDDVFEHYCPRWSKRYMRRRLRRRGPGERIPFSKARVRAFKGYWNFALLVRKARRSWRGLWRKT